MLLKVYETIYENGETVRRALYINSNMVSDMFLDQKGMHIFLIRGKDILITQPDDVSEAAAVSTLFKEFQTKLIEWEMQHDIIWYDPADKVEIGRGE